MKEVKVRYTNEVITARDALMAGKGNNDVQCPECDSDVRLHTGEYPHAEHEVGQGLYCSLRDPRATLSPR